MLAESAPRLIDPLASTLPISDCRFENCQIVEGNCRVGVIIAEDGEGVQHLVGATAEGTTFPVARNDFTDASKNVEFTGPV